MFDSLVKKTIGNESGMVSILSLMTLVILTVAGVVAITISNNETGIVRNEQIAAIDFYEAESGLNDARVNYNNWLDNDFLTEAQTAANSTFDTIAEDEHGNPLATVRARCIENNNSGDVTPIFNNVADEMPAMAHIGNPPEGSGYSLKYFESRRYSLTATSGSGNTIVQAGVWKVFNKY
ncbi:hypothetical protein DSCW_14990 [Desulfosarcina widdelii]|uniref:Type 4 fimbrial biogenesis protein PilX N-terminal domain-containing protein n=1 Tax=Desulfosarcina widdelii TaxID=947919 RepID=A0A5K7YWF0_9BACT|nr:hypothetical protein [Desulfosarcina widdelii]BBO74082.1 hypothetical protein DSCW_14990 [Desulfosarcina widdelii]